MNINNDHIDDTLTCSQCEQKNKCDMAFVRTPKTCEDYCMTHPAPTPVTKNDDAQSATSDDVQPATSDDVPTITIDQEQLYVLNALNNCIDSIERLDAENVVITKADGLEKFNFLNSILDEQSSTHWRRAVICLEVYGKTYLCSTDQQSIFFVDVSLYEFKKGVVYIPFKNKSGIVYVPALSRKESTAVEIDVALKEKEFVPALEFPAKAMLLQAIKMKKNIDDDLHADDFANCKNSGEQLAFAYQSALNGRPFISGQVLSSLAILKYGMSMRWSSPKNNVSDVCFSNAEIMAYCKGIYDLDWRTDDDAE